MSAGSADEMSGQGLLDRDGAAARRPSSTRLVSADQDERTADVGVMKRPTN